MKKTLIAVATALTLSTSIALASAPTGFYVQGQLGMGGVQGQDSQDPFTGDQLSSSGKQKVAFGFGLGYLTPTSNSAVAFGPELSMTHYSKQDVDLNAVKVGTFDTNSLNIAGVLKLAPMSFDGVYMLGKVGIAYMMQTSNLTTSGGGKSQSNTYSPLLAAGLGYDFGNFGVNVTGQYVFGIKTPDYTVASTGSNAPAFAVMAGVTYAFA